MLGTWLAAAAICLTNPPANAKLGVRDIQAVEVLLGPKRKTLDYYPEDEASFRYRITGVQTDKEGKVKGEMTVRLTGADGKELLNNKVPIESVLALGGNSVPGFAHVVFAPNITPAEYTLTVSFKDIHSGQSASFERKLKVKPAQFAIVAPRFFYDAQGKIPAPAGGLLGQTLFFRIKVIGFNRGQEKIDAQMAVHVVDAKTKAVVTKPIKAVLKNNDPDLVKKATNLTFVAFVGLNRTGKFRLQIVVADNIGKKSTEMDLPLDVRAP